MDQKVLRAVSSYDPSKAIKNFIGGDNRKYLPLEAGMAWFHHYLMERNIDGLIDDSELEVLQGTKLLIGRASIYLNGELVGKSCSGAAIDESRPDIMTIGQSIASTAKWRALENAGFGFEDAIERSVILQPQDDAAAEEAKMNDIRACSYDPIPDMTFITEEGKQPNPYLEVGYRVRWFHQWLRDNRATGYIDDSDVRYYPEIKMLMAKAYVYINGKLVGTSCATKPFDPDEKYDINPISYACTQAKGRALNNAGFGIQSMNREDKLGETPLWNVINDGTAPIPGIPPLVKGSTPAQPAAQTAPVPPVAPPPAPQTPPPAAPVSGEGEGDPGEPGEKPEKKRGGRKPKGTKSTEKPADEPMTDPAPEQPQAPALPEMPRAEALAFIVPVGPESIKGKTVGEVLGFNRNFLTYYASDKFVNAKYTDFKRAAIAALKGV